MSSAKTIATLIAVFDVREVVAKSGKTFHEIGLPFTEIPDTPIIQKVVYKGGKIVIE